FTKILSGLEYLSFIVLGAFTIYRYKVKTNKYQFKKHDRILYNKSLTAAIVFIGIALIALSDWTFDASQDRKFSGLINKRDLNGAASGSITNFYPNSNQPSSSSSGKNNGNSNGGEEGSTSTTTSESSKVWGFSMDDVQLIYEVICYILLACAGFNFFIVSSGASSW
ncbi:hypothetical protein EV182_005056, partial [Spiromyces aspiralis]